MSPTDPTIPPQSSTGTNKVVKKKFWTKSRMIAAGVGIALVSYLVYARQDIEDYFDSERPPIIVNSGGSVNFDIHWHIKGKGKWKPPMIGNGLVFQHEHGNNKPTRIVLTPKKYASCTNDTGTSVTPPFSDTRVDIKIGNGSNINETVTLIVGPDYLMANFMSPPSVLNGETTLSSYTGDPTVWIREMLVGNITCKFDDDKGSIKVKQRK